MRSITIRYSYAGMKPHGKAISDFITAIDADPQAAGRFTYQVAAADDGETRIHWGRWDNPETLSHVQSQAHFKIFAAKVKEFSGTGPEATGHTVQFKTNGW